jgi:hypothetical protein
MSKDVKESSTWAIPAFVWTAENHENHPSRKSMESGMLLLEATCLLHHLQKPLLECVNTCTGYETLQLYILAANSKQPGKFMLDV